MLAAALQLTDVDPPYGKAPMAQFAEKVVPDDSPAKEFLEGSKEMVLTTQVCVLQKPFNLLDPRSLICCHYQLLYKHWLQPMQRLSGSCMIGFGLQQPHHAHLLVDRVRAHCTGQQHAAAVCPCAGLSRLASPGTIDFSGVQTF